MRRSWHTSAGWVLVLGVVVSLSGCSDDPVEPDGPGQISVTTASTGDEIDPDGYALVLDGGSAGAIAVNATTTVSDVAPGSHELRLDGVAANCAISGANPRTIQVASGSVASTTYVVTCVPTVGTLEVETVTTGDALDDGYRFLLNGTDSGPIGIDDIISVPGVAPGTAVVELADVAPNCTVGGENPRSANVVAGETVRVVFDVACSAVTGDLRVVTSTSGSGLDDGYEVSVDGGAAVAIGIADTLVVSQLASGDHTVLLSDVAGNCTVSGDNPRTSTVVAGAVAEARFDVACAAEVGTVRVTTDTWGLGLDSGYEVAVTGAGSTAIGGSATVTIDDVPAGDVAVELTGIAGNCSVQGANPVAVTLADGATADVSFPVFCFQSLSSQIAFESDRAGSRDVWVMGTSGSSPVPLTRFAGIEREPDVAPDGSAIVFDSDEAGEFDIWILDASGIRNLSSQVGIERSPSFSGDGSVVIYAHRSSSTTWEIWGVNRNGSSRARVMSEAEAAKGDDEQPAWSADGNWIAFRSDRDEPGNSDIYVMDAGGGNIRRLTTDAGEDGKPAWSSDGTRITWSSDRSGSFDVWRAEIDPVVGTLSNLKNLTEGSAGTDGKSDWRPGSSEIAFASDTEGDDEIFKIQDAVPGQPVPTPVRLTDNSDWDVEPSWSP